MVSRQKIVALCQRNFKKFTMENLVVSTENSIKDHIISQFEKAKGKRIPEGYIYTRKDGRKFRMTNGKYVYFSDKNKGEEKKSEEKKKTPKIEAPLSLNDAIDKTWEKLTGKPIEQLNTEKQDGESKSDHIRRLHEQGKTKSEIAKLTGASYPHVHKVVSAKKEDSKEQPKVEEKKDLAKQIEKVADVIKSKEKK